MGVAGRRVGFRCFLRPVEWRSRQLSGAFPTTKADDNL